MASAETTSAGMRSASASATALFPEAVGPKTASTCPPGLWPETAVSIRAEGPAAGLPPLRA